MKFSLEQLCGSVVCTAQAKKWWNERDCLCVGYPSQIISLDWGYNQYFIIIHLNITDIVLVFI
jgi:hypothetical protein